MKALIDADIVCYSAGFACQKTQYYVTDGYQTFGNYTNKKEAIGSITDDYCYVDDKVEVEPVEYCLFTVKRMLQNILRTTGADSYQLYLTGKGNFREKIATIKKYKGNRSVPKPIHYQAVRNYMIKYWNAEVVNGMEADDALGIHQKYDKSTAICSIDKDLDMIPGRHYNWLHNKKYFVSEEEAIKTFYTQLLTGDATDNIPGIYGMGPAKAKALLKDVDDQSEMYQIVLDQYKKVYSNQDGYYIYQHWESGKTIKSTPEQILDEHINLIWISRDLKEAQEK